MAPAKAMADFDNHFARDEKLAGLMTRKLLLFDGFEGLPQAMHLIDREAPRIVFTIDACALYFDDWYCNRGDPKWGEQRAWADCVAPQFTDWCRYATLGHHFIIHR